MDMTETELKEYLGKLFATLNITQISELVGMMTMREGPHATYFRQASLDRVKQFQVGLAS